MVGCESSQKEKEKIFDALKKKKIISENMEQIDKETSYSWSLEMCATTNYYIYRDNDSKIIAIKYE